MARKSKPTADELTFWDHVEELRTRIIRSLAYIGVGAAVAWVVRKQLLAALEYPAVEGARRAKVEGFTFKIFESAGGFMLMIQIALAAGVVLAVPLLLLELWGFLAPALRPKEKKWVIWAVPLATTLFLAGVASCYWVAPSAFAFFFSFNRTLGVQPELTLSPYLFFFLRLALAFGGLFQLPLFLMLLASLGFVTSRKLVQQWRLAIVLIFVAAAMATPTPDAVTMSVCAAPMVILYVLSVIMVKFVEKPREQVEEPTEEGEDGHGDGEDDGGDGSPAEPTPEVDIDEIYRRLNEENANLDR
jgi:sec-independent protein translocase protein TatC